MAYRHKTPDEIEKDALTFATKFKVASLKQAMKDYKKRLAPFPQAVEVLKRAIQLRKDMDKVSAGIDKDRT